LSILPLLESVQLKKWRIYGRAASHLFIRLMKKKSLKSMAMLRTDMGRDLASKLLQIYKDSDECDQLEFLSFYKDTSSREQWDLQWKEQWDFQWQEDIDSQLAETAHIKHTRRSVSDLMNNIKSRDKSSNGSNEELQFITDIVDANEKDSEQEMQYETCSSSRWITLVLSCDKNALWTDRAPYFTCFANPLNCCFCMPFLSFTINH
jgi:hypothetical protein